MTMPSTSNPQQPSQSQHFLLKWNNHRSNMVNVFESLFHEENLVDITLAVEGKFLKAHKIILSACSPYFQSLFITQIPNEKHPILIFHDLKFNHLKILLEFMYLGEISIDEKDLSDVLRVAESLSIRGLSSFDSDDEDSSSEQKMKAENGNNQSSQPPTTSSSSSTNAHQSQTFDNHFHGRPGSPDSCDSDSPAPSVTVTPTPIPPKQKSTKAKKAGAAAAVAVSASRSERTEAPPIIKRKRGRQPGTKMTNSSDANSLGAKSKIPSRHLDSSKPASHPRQGVRRRLPKKYNSQPPLIKRERLSNSSETLDPESSELVIDFQDYADSDSTNGTPLHPDLSNSEPLSEMSVRGLDLFRYASVEDGVYKCMECEKLRIPKTFKNKYSFQRHAFLYHEGNMRKVFPCPVCCREFSRPDKMKNHLRSIHQDGGSNGKGCMSPDGRNEDSGTF